MIRVLLVDDHQLFRLSLHLLLNRQWGIAVVGEAQDGVEALEAVKDLAPDVVVMDLNLPRLNGFEATRRIASHSPRTRVIGYSILDKEQAEPAMILSGAYACVGKDDGIPALLLAIRSAGSGAGAAEAV